MLVKQLSSQEANLRLLVNEWGSKNTTTTTKRTLDVQSCKATLVVRAEQSGQQISTKGLADNLKGVKILNKPRFVCVGACVCVCVCERKLYTLATMLHGSHCAASAVESVEGNNCVSACVCLSVLQTPQASHTVHMHPYAHIYIYTFAVCR